MGSVLSSGANGDEKMDFVKEAIKGEVPGFGQDGLVPDNLVTTSIGFTFGSAVDTRSSVEPGSCQSLRLLFMPYTL
jgi:hypothetical protein